MTKRHDPSNAARRAALAALCMAAAIGAGAAHAADAGAPACELVDAPASEFTVRVPFEVVDGRIYVQAEVDGHGPFRFAVDTGASGLARADASLVSALGLRIERPAANSDGIRTSAVDTTRLRSLRLGGLSRENLQVMTRDYNGTMAPEAAFAGIIAREFFADGLLVIDYPSKTLSFSRALSIAPGQAGALAYERPFRVPVSIGNVRTEGNLDTGANVEFVLPRSLFDKVGGTQLQAAGDGRLTNSRVETARSIVHGPFRIGRATVEDQQVRVSDKYPELLVGARTLQKFAVLIDQRSRRVAVCP